MYRSYAFRSAICAALLLAGASAAAQSKGDALDVQVLELAKKECPGVPGKLGAAAHLYVLGKKLGLEGKQITLLNHYCGFYLDGWRAGRAAEKKDEKSSG